MMSLSLIKLMQFFSRFTADCRGNLAISIAILAVPLIAAVGGGRLIIPDYIMSNRECRISQMAQL